MTRTFRIFVSSTFADFKDERNALQSIYPRLRTLCLGSGARFQAIDLRWGVSDEASLDQQTVGVCLDEIRRCQGTSMRPNFIVLLGNRYGWRPLPPVIIANEFRAIRETLDAAERALVSQWYRKDENAIRHEYWLVPRQKKYEEQATWETVERDLRSTLLSGAARANLPPQERTKYEASATELEIIKGALTVPDASEHVFCFFREINGLPEQTTARDFVDLHANGEVNRDARTAVEALKDKLRSLLAGHVFEYEAVWTGAGITHDHLPQLCEDVYASLAAIIEAELSRLPPRETAEAEAEHHLAFGANRRRLFVGRSSERQQIASYAADGHLSPLVVVGASGSGKTALAAQVAEDTRNHSPSSNVIERFIGASARASDGRLLLQDLCRTIAETYGDTEPSPVAYSDLVAEFPRRLALATAERPLLIFLDALDQLNDRDPARDLAWLPPALPKHAGLVVSTIPGGPVEALKRRLPSGSFLNLNPMPPAEGAKLLDLWLGDCGRRLQVEQRKEVLAKFSEQGLPLYLKLAFEEARRWRSDTPASETMLESSVSGIIRRLFVRLSAEENHGAALVSLSLGYLSVARNGLSEDELLDVLSRDPEVMGAFRIRSPRSPPVELLPVVVWSRLSLDLEPYLSERDADGTSLLTFFHRQLTDVVVEDYLAGEEKSSLHQKLARYFEDQALEMETERGTTANMRKLSELPFQQTFGELWEGLYSTLTDFRFLELKVSELGVEERVDASGRVQRVHGGVFLLQDDFEQALRRWPNLERNLMTELPHGHARHRDTIAAFARSLRLEAHVLLTRPELLWQQVHNRLQWEGEVLASLPAGRLDPRPLRPGSPWLRLRTRFPESEALLRTLAGHDDWVNGCAISSDGSLVASASADKTVKLWDAASGALRKELAGHDGLVNACAISPDGWTVASASLDETVKVWDVDSGHELGQLIGHEGQVNACAFTPDGRRLLSAGNDGKLRLWRLDTFGLLRTLEGHGDRVVACACAPDSRFFVSASQDLMLLLWDADLLVVRAELRGHAAWATCCAVAPDSSFVASGDASGVVKVWNATTGEEMWTRDAHAEGITSCAINPDGSLLVTASEDTTLKVWSMADAGLRATLVAHSRSVESCAFSSQGSRLVSAGGDGLKLWEAAALAETGTAAHSGPVSACAICNEPPLVVSASWDGTLKVWNSESCEERATFTEHNSGVTSCDVSADGFGVISGDENGTLKLWDPVTGSVLHTLSGHEGKVNDCAISRSGTVIASAGADRTLRLWDPGTGSELATCRGHEGEVWACAVSRDGTKAVSASQDGKLRIWDVASGLEQATLRGHEGFVWDCALSPDGDLVVSAGSDRTVRLWDTRTGLEVDVLGGHTKGVTTCRLSEDASLVASAGIDGTVRVWDIKGMVKRVVFDGHDGEVWTTEFVPGSHFVVSGGLDKFLKVWDARSGAEVAAIPLSGAIRCLAVDQRRPFFVCGGDGGFLHVIEAVGIAWGD